MFTWGNNHFSIFDVSPAPKHEENLNIYASKKSPTISATFNAKTPLGLSNPSLLNSGLPSLKISPKKRSSKRDFRIFVDPETIHDAPTPKKSRRDAREPLSIRTQSANSTPAPSPRLPSTPFPVSAEDPFWLDQENYDTHAVPTPPVTPGLSSSASDAVPGTGHPAPPPREQVPRRSVRISRLRRTTTHTPLSRPVSMVLYEVLEIQEWNVGVGEIVAAYRDVVMKVHPDKVSEEEREEATEKMQMVNGAKEVLIHPDLRCKYHEDGILPWSA